MARIQYRPGFLLAAKNNQEIAYHGSLLFIVQLHDLPVAKSIKSLVDHSDSALDNLLSGRNDRTRLLPP